MSRGRMDSVAGFLREENEDQEHTDKIVPCLLYKKQLVKNWKNVPSVTIFHVLAHNSISSIQFRCLKKQRQAQLICMSRPL